MNKEIAVVTGLGFGEEAKGATVEWLTKKLHAHTILRSGGCQSGHQVMLNNGIEHQFTHFGAGTFEGAKTHLVDIVINPVDLFEEALELEKKGIKKPFSLITVDSNCIALTPYHSAISRFREIMRGPDKKGTVGKGVGEAIKDSKNPVISIRARDFFDEPEIVEQKIENIRKAKLEAAREIMAKTKERLPDAAQAELEILFNKNLVSITAEAFRYIADIVDIVGPSHMAEILAKDGNIINEPDHGVLHHPWYGFVPHVTQVDPTSGSLIVTINSHNYKGRIFRLGVSRSYMTRHGAGPLVSYNRELTNSIKETHNNKAEDNAWLGEFRSGHYDIVAMKYSVEVSGGQSVYGGLNLSYMDEVFKAKEWGVCVAYEYDGKLFDLEKYFKLENGLITGIKVHPNTRDTNHLNHQIQLTQLLKECHPVITTLKPEVGKPLTEVFIKFVEDNLKIPVVATSSGPRASDKQVRPGYEELFAV